MATAPAVHSEDDNFIVGEGRKYDRLRKDARQLHLSKFNETRSKAHYARYRNAALKCSLDSTHKTIEREKARRVGEIERTRLQIVKTQQKYNIGSKRASLPRIQSKTSSLSAGNTVARTTTRVEMPKMAAQVREEFCDDLCPLSEDRANSWLQKKGFDRNDVIRSGDSKKSQEKCESMNHVSEPMTERASTNDETGTRSRSSSSRKQSISINLSHRSSLSERGATGLVRASSPGKDPCGPRRRQSLNGRYNNKLKPIDEKRIAQREKKKGDQLWRDFDGLLKWFADYLQIEHKPLSMVPGDDDDKEKAHAQNTPRVVMPQSSMSPLYFRYGLPEDSVIRLC